MATDNDNKKTEALRRRTSKIIKWMWLAFAMFVVFATIFFVMAYNGLVGYMPPVEELKNPRINSHR